jgi:hypothetical protein
MKKVVEVVKKSIENAKSLKKKIFHEWNRLQSGFKCSTAPLATSLDAQTLSASRQTAPLAIRLDA